MPINNQQPRFGRVLKTMRRSLISMLSHKFTSIYPIKFGHWVITNQVWWFTLQTKIQYIIGSFF